MGRFDSLHYFIYFVDDLPIPPGMSKKLKINQNDQNATSSFCTTNTVLDDEWAEDVGGFWDDEVPEVVNQPEHIISEQILLDEINHIKVKL